MWDGCCIFSTFCTVSLITENESYAWVLHESPASVKHFSCSPEPRLNSHLHPSEGFFCLTPRNKSSMAFRHMVLHVFPQAVFRVWITPSALNWALSSILCFGRRATGNNHFPSLPTPPWLPVGQDSLHPATRLEEQTSTRRSFLICLHFYFSSFICCPKNVRTESRT